MTETYDLPIELRNVVPADRNMVISSWQRCIADLYDHGKAPRNWIMASQRALIISLLLRSNTIIACDTINRDQIFGYMVAELGAGVLHWIYTKKNFRHNKVAARLMEVLRSKHKKIICTQPTPSINDIARLKWDMIEFDLRKLREPHGA